jgi:hypothetical protein
MVLERNSPRDLNYAVGSIQFAPNAGNSTLAGATRGGARPK